MPHVLLPSIRFLILQDATLTMLSLDPTQAERSLHEQYKYIWRFSINTCDIRATRDQKFLSETFAYKQRASKEEQRQ